MTGNVRGFAATRSVLLSVRFLVPALLAPLAGMGQAEAACSPTSGQNNVAVTCSTNTTNQDGTSGYGQGTETGVTVTVTGGAPGATVTGSDNGISLGANATITVQSGATVTGTNFRGIDFGFGTVSNAGTISGGAVGIEASGGSGQAFTVHNSGTISGGVGVDSIGNVTLDNSNSIAGTTSGIVSTRTATVTSNTGTISGGNQGISAQDSNVTNNGFIEALNATGVAIGGFQVGQDSTVTINSNDGKVEAFGAGGIAVQGQTVTVNSNTNFIGGDAFGINATGTATVKNSVGGTIQALAVNGIAIGDNSSPLQNTVTLDNAGTVKAVAAGGVAIQGSTVNVNSNTGDIVGDKGAIRAIVGSGTANVTNSNNITANDQSGIAIEAVTANVNNLAGGTISAGNNSGAGINASALVLNNAGKITADIGVFGNDTATVNNTGQITATNVAISGGSFTITNSGAIVGVNAAVDAESANIVNLAAGTIQGAGVGINVRSGTLTLVNAGQITSATSAAISENASAGSANVVNASTGVISGALQGIFSEGSATVVNAGRIESTAINGTAIFVKRSVTIANTGTISGNVAIKTSEVAAITNFGTIQSTAGATGTAIQFSGGNGDTLNVKKGSQIVGLLDFGDGHDVVNVDSTAPQTPKGVSSLSRATSAVVDALKQQFVNAENVVVNIVGSFSGAGQPTVTVNGVTAALDPTALSQQDRALMDFTGGMSSMVQGRLSGGGNVLSASYGLEDAHAEMFSKSPAASWSPKVNVWSSMFGAVRSQGGTDTTLDSSSSAFGGAIGIDRRIAPNWLVGVFLGGGNGTLNVSLSSQKIDTDYFSGGAYSRFEWGPQFVDTTLQVGAMNNHSSRLVQNNVTGGLDHATASYNGWFVSPEIAYGYHINFGNGAVLTPIVRARYVAGFFDGFSESGSAQTLSVGSRTLQDFEERGELEYARTANFFGGDQPTKLTIHGGVIAWQRAGDATVNAVLIGQSLSFVTPGKSSAVGGVVGGGFDHQIRPNVALFGSVEGTFMSDESRLVTAKGGLRVAF